MCCILFLVPLPGEAVVTVYSTCCWRDFIKTVFCYAGMQPPSDEKRPLTEQASYGPDFHKGCDAQYNSNYNPFCRT